MHRITLVTILLATILLPSAVLANVNGQGVVLTPKDNLAKQVIIGNASDAVDHKWDRYDLLVGSMKGDSSNFTIYKSGNGTVPPIHCGEGTHNENGVCVPDGEKCPEGQFWNATAMECQDNPKPPVVNETGDKTTIDLAGDFDGTSVIKAMKGDYNIGLGDLMYQSTLDNFIKAWDVKENHACVVGNHNTLEDGNTVISKQSKEYCGDVWVKKVANGTTLLVGVNTNGDLGSIKGTVMASLGNEDYMNGVKNVLLLTHKPCDTHPNSHHTVESAVGDFCNAVKNAVHVNFVTIAGHNHEIAKKSDGSSYLAGGGGKTSHRGCGTGNGWDWCKEQTGFLRLTIDNDSGKITAKFYNTSGGVIS